MKINKSDKNNIEVKELKLNTDINKKNLLLDDEVNKNALIINEINIDNENENDDYMNNNNYDKNNESSIEIPKLNFWDFIINNVYLKKLCKSKKQELISISNQIIQKYLSIDNILYNQIKMENLLKDYKWNNQHLNNLDLDNNELMNKLKFYI